MPKTVVGQYAMTLFACTWKIFIFTSSKKNCWNMLCFNFRKAESQILLWLLLIIIINNRTSCHLIWSVIKNCMLDTSHFSLLISQIDWIALLHYLHVAIKPVILYKSVLKHVLSELFPLLVTPLTNVGRV